ncbi:MAG TPA: glycosyltransferase family 2 protein [Thermoflexales bacterium]|nr:glycosyltransferase family 2 protein [Thermoflexales bacterium]HQW33913.1 glycosyltransferase family 2 protein [Thermoflexales bacterium]HQZ21265.1 glycosyltransferase family 2 protein [Thermoflexales bacterium]
MLPIVSVIILCHNKSEYTHRCLCALEKAGSADTEILIWDNASSDDTAEVVKSHQAALPALTYFRSEENIGFGAGNNRAAEKAVGEFLFFLNNDTEPQPGWMEPLLDAFRRDPKTGAVGSKLVYPDGRLQEAGGLIFSDASGHNIGKGSDPLEPLFNIPREVDYCSGAALMIRASLFRQLGGFDKLFDPAYYEDTDLCFSVRKAGYAVMVEPRSTVIHHEGGTAGTDTGKGFKRFQNINRGKFARKWARELAKQPTPVDKPSDGWRLADRRTRSMAPNSLFHLSAGSHALSLPSGGLTFGQGCYADEGGWRWLGPHARFFIWSEMFGSAPLSLFFDLAADELKNYNCDSFKVEIYINDKVEKIIEFATNTTINHIEITLMPEEADAYVRIRSGAMFVPGQLNNSSDMRELSVCLRNLKLNALPAL